MFLLMSCPLDDTFGPARGCQSLVSSPQGFIIQFSARTRHPYGHRHAYHRPEGTSTIFIKSHFRDLCLNTFLRALPDGEHGDLTGCHTDDDTQHGEEGASLSSGARRAILKRFVLFIFISLHQSLAALPELLPLKRHFRVFIL